MSRTYIWCEDSRIHGIFDVCMLHINVTYFERSEHAWIGMKCTRDFDSVRRGLRFRQGSYACNETLTYANDWVIVRFVVNM